MVGTTSNIYVSIGGPRDSGRKDGYRKPLHAWMISVEPHYTHVPGTSYKQTEPLHYAATKDTETGAWTVEPHEITDEPGIIGNILIVESAHIQPDKIHGMLKEDMASSPSKDMASSDDEPEHWILSVIHGLQRRNIAQHFDIDEFIMYTHGYLANRLDNEAPALIAYPKIHKEPEKKSSKHKFWVTTPMANRTKTNTSGEALKYGGLM